ncbi:MAG: hypothetical protein QMB61_07090, partial [Clostridiaceae bacterium]
ISVYLRTGKAGYYRTIGSGINTQGQMIGKRRLMAAYHMLYTKNEAEAMRHRAAFEDQCKRYPILGEIEWERQLLDRIRIKAEADQDTAAHRPMPIIE